LLAFVFLPAFTVAVLEINDTTIYKPCIVDLTACPDDHSCIQYFCYPKVASEADPLTSCKKNSHCDGWKPDKTQKCFKEGQNGVCIAAEDYDKCEAHEECDSRGGKCCGDYCCNAEYFDALLKLNCTKGDENCEEAKAVMAGQEKKSLECTTDQLCEEKHTGHTCCEDNSLLKNIDLSDSMENWNGSKRCCTSATNQPRKLSEVDERLTSGDWAKISQEVATLPSAKQEEMCKELEKPISEEILTCKTLLDENKSKLDAQKKTKLEEEQAVEAATAAASDVETASEKAEIQMKTAENATIAAETAQTTAETSEDLDKIKTANTTAHAEAKKAQTAAEKAAEEVKTAKTALNTTETEAAKAGSKKAEADKVVKAATDFAQNAADSATKAKGHATKANAAAAAAKTAAEKFVEEANNPKTSEITTNPTNPTDKTSNVTPEEPVITFPKPDVNVSKEVSSESKPEIPATPKTIVDSKPEPTQKSPKETNSGNAVTMSTIGFISCLILYSLINQLEVPASLF